MSDTADKQAYQVLYRSRAAWEVGEGSPDHRPGEHYPGDYAGKVISVVKAGHAWGPGDLEDPARRLLAVELTAEELALLRSGQRKIVNDGLANVSHEDSWGSLSEAIYALEGHHDYDEEATRLAKALPPVILHAAEKEA